MQAKPHEALRVAAGSSLRAKLESWILVYCTRILTARGANTILTYSEVRPARSPAASVVEGV